MEEPSAMMYVDLPKEAIQTLMESLTFVFLCACMLPYMAAKSANLDQKQQLAHGIELQKKIDHALHASMHGSVSNNRLVDNKTAREFWPEGTTAHGMELQTKRDHALQATDSESVGKRRKDEQRL
jgi:hypothetical protein